MITLLLLLLLLLLHLQISGRINAIGRSRSPIGIPQPELVSVTMTFEPLTLKA